MMITHAKRERKTLGECCAFMADVLAWKYPVRSKRETDRSHAVAHSFDEETHQAFFHLLNFY